MEGFKKAEEAFSLDAMMKSFFNVQEKIWKFNQMNMKEIRKIVKTKFLQNSVQIFKIYTVDKMISFESNKDKKTYLPEFIIIRSNPASNNTTTP